MTKRSVVVIGGSPGGLRAAAAVAATDRRVALLVPDDHPGGAAYPDIPAGTGVVTWQGPERSLSRQLLGRMARLDPLRQAVWLGGRLWPLPWGRMDLLRALRGDVLRALGGWSLVRFRDEFADQIGYWSEVRTYRDWVTIRWGTTAAARLYLDYCARRWGSPDEVSAAMADWYHRPMAGFRRMAPQMGPAERVGRLSSIVRQQGEIHLGVTPARLLWRDGRVVGVESNSGQVYEGDVLAAGAPSQVLRLGGAAVDVPLRTDAGWLQTRHRLVVQVPAKEAHLPFQVSILDPSTPFYRSLRLSLLPRCAASAGHLALHADVAPDDPLWTASDEALGELARQWLAQGLAEPLPGRVRVNRLAHHVPVWTRRSQPARLRVLNAYHGWGMAGVGRAGVFAPLDPQQELRYLAHLLQDEHPQQEAIRRVVDEAATTGVSSSGAWLGFLGRW